MGLFKKIKQIKNDNASFSFPVLLDGHYELEKMYKNIFNDNLIKLKQKKKNKQHKEK
tara:strand:+ start:2628 stop:2798 length:171 start_codon:yes stop_codon:yes gene_type:complete